MRSVIGFFASNAEKGMDAVLVDLTGIPGFIRFRVEGLGSTG